MLLRRFYYLFPALKREWKRTEEIEEISFKMLRNLLQDVVHTYFRNRIQLLNRKQRMNRMWFYIFYIFSGFSPEEIYLHIAEVFDGD
jgi:hypothetical protein